MGSFLSSQSQIPPARSSVAPVPAAIASPPWMLLAPYGGGYREACNITGDSKTIAAAATSNGQRISVSLRREPFSALSRICLRFLPGAANDWHSAYSTVIAVHGGSILLMITSNEGHLKPKASDYFVYRNMFAADTPARLPSLYLLPRYTSTKQWMSLDVSATGLLCHGEADFVVAELTIVGSKDDAAMAARPIAFELRLFRHGEWSVKRPWIIHGHGIRMYRNQLRDRWETIAVVPLGNGMLCWVDWHSGVIFSDVLDEGPIKLRYVPYPEECSSVYTDVRGAVKLVSIAPHRCTHCGCSEHATAIDIWTLNTDDMAWVLETKTNMVDSTELWELPSKVGYARVHLVYPLASMNGGGHVVAGMNGGGNVVSDDSPTPMEEEDEHMSLRVSTPSVTASLHDGLQGGNGATSASTPDQQQGDNGPATVGRWPKRRRRANSMVTGPEWTA